MNTYSLMADLCALSSVLHSLQVKLAVDAQKSNPKVRHDCDDLNIKESGIYLLQPLQSVHPGVHVELSLGRLHQPSTCIVSTLTSGDSIFEKLCP